MSIKIKITMICHIDNGILIWNRIIYKSQLIVFCQLICNMHIQRSRISLIPIRTMQNKFYFRICFFTHIPDSLIIIICSTVKIISIFIFLKFICLILNCNNCTSDTVRITTYRCAKRYGSFFVSGHIIIPQNYIS